MTDKKPKWTLIDCKFTAMGPNFDPNLDNHEAAKTAVDNILHFIENYDPEDRSRFTDISDM